MPRTNARCYGNRLLGVLSGLIVCISLGGGAAAAPIQFLGANVGQTPLFDADLGPQGEWNIPNAPLTNGSLMDDDFRFLEISSNPHPAGSLSWTGNALAIDGSSGGRAYGVFFNGGEMSIYGRLIEFGSVIFDGLLLRGRVSGFSVREPAGGDNLLDTEVSAQVTALEGALMDGSQGLTMPVPYYFQWTGAQVVQNGGDLMNFQQDIQIIASFQFNMFQVPEPGTLALLGGGLLVLVKRRRGA